MAQPFSDWDNTAYGNPVVATEPGDTKKWFEANVAIPCVEFALDLWLHGMSDAESENFLTGLNYFDWVYPSGHPDAGQPVPAFTAGDWAKLKSKALGWRNVSRDGAAWRINPTSIKGHAKACAKAFGELYRQDAGEASSGDGGWALKAAHYLTDVFNEDIVTGASVSGWDGEKGIIGPEEFLAGVSFAALTGCFGLSKSTGVQMPQVKKYMAAKKSAVYHGIGSSRAWCQYVPIESVEYIWMQPGTGHYGYRYRWTPVKASESTYTIGPASGDLQTDYTTGDFGLGNTPMVLSHIKALSTTELDRGFPKFKIRGKSIDRDYEEDDTLWAYVAQPESIQDTHWRQPTADKNNELVMRIARNFPKIVQDILWGLVKEFLKDEAAPPAAVDQDPAEDDAGGVKDKGPLQYLDDPSKLNPVDYQCFLFERVRDLTAAKEMMHLTKPYKQFACIDASATTAKPGNLISLLQGGHDTGKQAMLRMCPDIYALLTPHIKIYRVDYTKDDKLAPYKETQIPFPNFIDPSDITNITKGNWGRFAGAGIKSFSWSLDGVQPEEVENNISANLKLYFQTVQDMFSMNWTGPETDPVAQAGITGQAGYLDLIIGSGTSFRQGDGEEINAAPARGSSACSAMDQRYEGENFRIKAVVGWSLPPDFATIAKSMGLTLIEADALTRGVKDSQTALYLQIVSHNLTFNEDGSVDLSIDYQAALSGILRAPNADLFVGSDIYKAEKEDLDTKIAEARETLRLRGESAPTAGSTSASANERNSAVQDDLKEMLEKKRSLSERDRLVKYKKFLSGLYDTGRVYIMPIGKHKWKEGLLRDMTPEARATAAVTRVLDDAEEEDAIYSVPEQSTEAIDRLAAHQAAVSSGGGSSSATPEDEVNREFMERIILSSDKKFSGEKLEIPFIYFGDLVESILTDLDFLNDGRSFQFLMGNVEVLDPLLAYQIQEVDLKCTDSSGKRVTTSIDKIDPFQLSGVHPELLFKTNIANIPISLSYFQEWFVNTVVAPKKEKYPFLRFIKNMCSGLIGKSFNTICFSKGLQTNMRFDTATFNSINHYPSNLNERWPFVKIEGAAGLIEDVKAARRASAATLTSKRNREGGETATIIPTMILYSVDSKPLTSKASGARKRKEDENKGIFHYAMGARCGLAKKITFQRNDMPFYREARVMRVGALGAEQLRELYQVNIDMVGNTLHKNGQYVYIEPVSIGGGAEGAGTIPNLARRLGFGGYYLVTKVASTVSDSGFDVSVSAIQEGIDFDGKVVGMRQYGGGALTTPGGTS